MKRREFLQITSAAGGGLLVSFSLPTWASSMHLPAHELSPNAWLRLSSSGQAVFTLGRTEMGQGVIASLPAILAEELDLDPSRLTIEFAPADSRYINPEIHLQATGGSSSVKTSWQPLREAGAATRWLLMEAAAREWQVPHHECETDNGVVIHPSSMRRFAYGDLVTKAAKLEITPHRPRLKSPDHFRYIGKSLKRPDSRAKVTGQAEFGIDVKVPNHLTAVVIRAPRLGDQVVSFDDRDARATPGFHTAVTIATGVAVVAANYWQARQAADKLQVKWQSVATPVDTPKLRAQYAELVKKPGRVAHHAGKFAKALGEAPVHVEATYEMPFLAHATMEPQNCTASVTERRCEIWAPTQAPGVAQELVAELLSLSRDQVIVHTTFLGGGFGRRLEQDFIAEAVLISQKIKQPVKVVWSREEDMQHDFYRPASLHHLQAGLSADGKVTALSHRIVAQSILNQVLPKWIPTMAPEWLPVSARKWVGRMAGRLASGPVIDPSAIEGAAELPYAIPNMVSEYVCADPVVPVGFWRSVGHSYNAFIVESFMDELAHAAHTDPLKFRQALLAHSPRHLRVLNLAAEKAGWGTQAVKGRGIAQHASFNSFAAQVVDVEVSADQIRVRRVVCAVDCGTVVNPDQVKAQVESAVIFGLSAALKGEITFDNGQVMQSNFHDYPVLSMAESPLIEVHLVESTEPPTGVGEISVPPIGPATANAIFAATGQRLRKMPFRLNPTQ